MGYYKRIRDLREDNDLTQKDIAEILKMKQPQYWRYEQGDKDPSTEILIKLADYYGTSIDYILGRTDEKKPYPNRIINNNIHINGGTNNNISFGNINIK